MLLLMAVNGLAQNLVPNPSFEDTVSCPTNGFLTDAQGWERYSSSPDYYNSCVDETFYGYSVPNNYTGIQAAASGQAYVGAICFVEGETDYSLNREILGHSLASPLSTGQKYFVSFKTVAIPNTLNVGSSMYVDKLGVLFSTVPYTNTNSSTIPPIQNFAHVYTDSIISDTVNWTTVFGSFTADSSYSYISVGNFFENSNTDTIHHTSSAFPSAYYLFDDICVSTDSLFTLNYIYTGIDEKNEESSLMVYPNPASNYINLEFDDYKEYIITIYNSTGQLMLSKTIIHQGIMNTESLSQGIYYIQSRQGNVVLNKKLIIY